jgi:hypothetical protein
VAVGSTLAFQRAPNIAWMTGLSQIPIGCRSCSDNDSRIPESFLFGKLCFSELARNCPLMSLQSASQPESPQQALFRNPFPENNLQTTTQGVSLS